MIHESFILREQFPDVTLTTYVCDTDTNYRHAPRPAIVICPGGGYSDLSAFEAEPIARQYLVAGYNVFILRYSVGENAAHYNPLIEVAMAVKYVREHAEEHHTDPNRMILCYPVITSAPGGHRHSFKRLCGKPDPTDEEAAEFSLELHVDETTPPAFLWHTVADRGVSVKNSLLMASALIEHGIHPELHIFPEGAHGLGLGSCETNGGDPHLLVPHVTPWMALSIAWIEDTFQ